MEALYEIERQNILDAYAFGMLDRATALAMLFDMVYKRKEYVK